MVGKAKLDKQDMHEQSEEFHKIISTNLEISRKKWEGHSFQDKIQKYQDAMNDYDQKKLDKKRKFMEALERMAARQNAKKENAMKQQTEDKQLNQEAGQMKEMQEPLLNGNGSGETLERPALDSQFVVESQTYNTGLQEKSPENSFDEIDP